MDEICNCKSCMEIRKEKYMKEKNQKVEPNKERIAEWVNELRYGGHNQATGQLVDLEPYSDEDEKPKANAYCCLGVACLVYARLNKKKGFNLSGEFMGVTDTLPKKVSDWYGLPDDNPSLCVNKKQKKYLTATELNDDFGYSFNKIADLLEKEYLK